MKKRILAIVVALSFGAVMALDQSEKGVATSPMSIYSGGIGAGGVLSLSDELKFDSHQFFKLSFISSVYLQDHIELFLDADWFAPGLNFGGDVGFDFFLTKSGFRPFLGAGVGAHYFEKSDNFSENIGPSATVHAGFTVEITEKVQVRFRVPYHVVANKSRDHAAGIDVGLLFSNGFRNIKKLDYNK
jgi:hypothetical protein